MLVASRLPISLSGPVKWRKTRRVRPDKHLKNSTLIKYQTLTFTHLVHAQSFVLICTHTHTHNHTLREQTQAGCVYCLALCVDVMRHPG